MYANMQVATATATATVEQVYMSPAFLAGRVVWGVGRHAVLYGESLALEVGRPHPQPEGLALAVDDGLLSAALGDHARVGRLDGDVRVLGAAVGDGFSS